MAKGKGQKKGGNNEREKAKQISRWWTEGERDDVFWRDNSGARATSRAKTGKSTAAGYGDITLSDPCGEALLRICTIELKRGYQELDMMALLDSKAEKTKIFLNFWRQVSRDSSLAEKNGWGKFPVLITHRDRKRPLITLDKKLFASIREFSGDYPNSRIIIENSEINAVVMVFEEWLEWCNPKTFTALYAKCSKKKVRRKW